MLAERVVGQGLPNVVRALGLVDRSRGCVDVGEEMRLGRLAGLRDVYHVTRPLGIALVAIARLNVVGRFESFGCLGQFTVGLEPNQALPRFPGVAAFVVTLPSAP